MDKITLPESSLFLLLLCANIDADLTNGELTEDEEKYILMLVNKWGFYDDFYSQSQLEGAIQKYHNVLNGSIRSTNEEDFIEQCAEILVTEPPIRDITYYLCLEILFLKGRIAKDSKEEILIGELEYQLKVSPDVADFIFGQQIFKTILSNDSIFKGE